MTENSQPIQKSSVPVAQTLSYSTRSKSSSSVPVPQTSSSRARSKSSSSILEEDVFEQIIAKADPQTISSSSSTTEDHSKALTKVNIQTPEETSKKIRLVPEFNGNNAQLHQFINACETVLTLIAEENKVNFFKILKLKLKDKAYDIIKYEELKVFKNLKTKLVAQFMETRS